MFVCVQRCVFHSFGQVCALKLSESQLQAALAAARHRADAASQLAAAANAARRMCEEQLEQLTATPQVIKRQRTVCDAFTRPDHRIHSGKAFYCYAVTAPGLPVYWHIMAVARDRPLRMPGTNARFP